MSESVSEKLMMSGAMLCGMLRDRVSLAAAGEEGEPMAVEGRRPVRYTNPSIIIL